MSFLVGAAIPLLAAAFITHPAARLGALVAASCVALFCFGTLGAVLGGAPWFRGGFRVLIGGWVWGGNGGV